MIAAMSTDDDIVDIAPGVSAFGVWLMLAASSGSSPIAHVLDVMGFTICCAAWASLVVSFPSDSWRSLWRAPRIR